MPGRLGYAGQVRRNCRLRRQFRKIFPGKNPDLGAGSDAGQAGGALGVEPLGEPSNEVGRARTKRPLGEPVLRGRWASQY